MKSVEINNIDHTNNTDVRSQYFLRLKESSKKVDKIIDGIFKSNNSQSFKTAKDLFQDRNSKSKMRPFLTQLSYELTGGKDEIEIATTISEINTYQHYAINWILDNKNEIFDKNDNTIIRNNISQILISSQIYRETTDILIEKLELESELELNLRKKINTQIINCYEGQSRELSMNIENIESYKSDKIFIEEYIKKSKLLSGDAYGLSAYIGGIINNSSEEILPKLFHLGTKLGTALHMSNDLGDFALLNETQTPLKSYQDQMADLKNGRLTLPIYFILKYGSQKEKDTILKIYKNNKNSYEDKLNASKTIMSSGAYEYSFRIIKNEYNKTKKILHHNFPTKTKKEKEAKQMLSIMISSIRSNKYVHALKAIKSPTLSQT